MPVTVKAINVFFVVIFNLSMIFLFFHELIFHYIVVFTGFLILIFSSFYQFHSGSGYSYCPFIVHLSGFFTGSIKIISIIILLWL